VTLARSIAFAAVALAIAPAAHAEIVLSNAWMRPVAAAQKEAQVYVDIRASEPMRLVGAASPLARRAELVLFDPPDPETGKLRVVPEIPVKANEETRLAFRGSHVRLVDVTRDAGPAERVPIQLVFVDAAGRRHVAATDALVRGLVPAPRKNVGDGLPPAAAKP